MPEPTYAELLGAFKDMESVNPRPLCVSVAPIEPEEAPAIRVFLWTSKQDAPLKSDCAIGPNGGLCCVGYQYAGFERRTVVFSMSSVERNIVFGGGSDPEWKCEDIVLSPPNIRRGEEYNCVAPRKLAKPSVNASLGETANVICCTEVPVGVGATELKLSIQTGISNE